MSKKVKNIVWHNSKVTRKEHCSLNGHKSCLLWFTGLSGAGKSTLAAAVEKELYKRKVHTYILDGDNIRHGLNSDLSFSPEDRRENIRRVGEVSKLFVDAGLFVLTALISPYKRDRDLVREMFNTGEYVEIYVKCSLEECERRDPKGLYKKARQNIIKDFTGISAPYEIPINPELIIETDKQSVENSVKQIMNYLDNNGYLVWENLNPFISTS